MASVTPAMVPVPSPMLQPTLPASTPENGAVAPALAIPALVVPSTPAVAPSAIGAPPVAADPIVTAVSYNPRFRESKSRSNRDSVFEEMLDEEDVTLRWITRDAAPLPFAVPAGCDSVEFFYGPLTVNDGVGSDDDLNQMVMPGAAQIQQDGETYEGKVIGALTPGSAVLVTVPWRAASFVTMGANHLTVTVNARFYANMQPLNDSDDE
jgi:hypothetical protein